MVPAFPNHWDITICWHILQVLGEYNKSVICFENTLKIQHDFEAATKRKHAVLCHSRLEAALEAQHRWGT